MGRRAPVPASSGQSDKQFELWPAILSGIIRKVVYFYMQKNHNIFLLNALCKHKALFCFEMDKFVLKFFNVNL